MTTESRPHLEPGPDHPITVGPHAGHVTVRAGETVVAETDRALELKEATYPAVLYIPLEDVDSAHLAPSDQHTYCPYKGEASYYDLTAAGSEGAGAVWYYPDPYPAVAPIQGHVAFYANRVHIASTADATS
jgi:uncharacterized protein (DUF427 family)